MMPEPILVQKKGANVGTERAHQVPGMMNEEQKDSGKPTHTCIAVQFQKGVDEAWGNVKAFREQEQKRKKRKFPTKERDNRVLVNGTLLTEYSQQMVLWGR